METLKTCMFKEIPILTSSTSVADLRQLVASCYNISDTDEFRMLMVLCGLPRSGKSTWARTTGVPLVEPDAIRLAFHGRPYIKEAEEWIWCITRTMVKSLFYAGHSDVVIGGCNTALKHRSQWSDNGRLWYRMICVFDTPVDDCLQRARNDMRPELLSVIRTMDSAFERPQSFEGAVAFIQSGP